MEKHNIMQQSIRPIDYLFDFAMSDERVRIVGLEGSRTNPNVPPDHFQDYDVSFVVTDMTSFLQDVQWLDFLGERLMMQTPENMALFPPELGNWFSYLMLFTDHSRIDLTLIPLEELSLYLAGDGLLEILLDKDRRCPPMAVPTDCHYHIKQPTVRFFEDCYNEFWLSATNVVKGLCRQELLYANDLFEKIVREELLRMLAWRVGFETQFSVSVGKRYKYLPAFLTTQEHETFVKTYHLSSVEATWHALTQAMALFIATSNTVATILHTSVPAYGENVKTYIEQLYRQNN
ncbi:aminoglycoside 6-adenylyltransferase [Lysinibacillus piscis]|uniref:Aminoglycoside 6-adenylyltransferase n=1 Tax=Lysinibacillus piscis TaxID=2518931 RepID=A0ABQ5NFF9_9BACI|nr:aminoglycoside 6-adenylyltransferase [Lysinibacillus sp. KH24]GLC87032.1 aminoglycoside 6-adenylyltransferase [Lysinibacillus sp. KH24]